MRGRSRTTGLRLSFRFGLSAVAASLLVAGLGACAFLAPRPEPEQVPPGQPEPIGPVVEIGRGESLGIRWRYLVYESALGFCTEIDGLGGVSCGGPVPGPEPPGSALGLMSMGSSTGSPSSISGFATDEVKAVRIELQDGGHVAATLMSLAPAGHEGQLWLAYVPEGRVIEEAVAVDADGEVLASQPVDGP